MANLMIERLKELTKPHVIFWHRGFRYEGMILAIDEVFVEFYDNERCYRKFFKIDEINDLELKE